MVSLIEALPRVFVPLSIFVGVSSILGLLGNILALYIFSVRFPPSGFNTLMAALSVYDIIACVIHMPLDIVTFFEVGHTVRTYLCKITCFQLAFTATGSAIILLGVAIVRFYGISKPLMGLVTSKSAHFVILVSVLMAMGIALPITFLFGSGELLTDDNVTAEICAVEGKFMDTKGPLAYYFILAALYVITFIAHSCLYAKSVYKLWHTRRVFVSVRGSKNVVMMSPQQPRDSNRFSRQSRTEQIKKTELSRSRSGSGSSQVPFCVEGRNLNRGNRIVTSSTMQEISEVHSDDASSNGDTMARDSIHMREDLSGRKASPRRGRNGYPPSPAAQRGKTSSTASSISSRGGSTAKRGNKNAVNQGSYRVLGVVVGISMTYFLSYAPHFGVMFYLFTHDMTVFRASAQNLLFEMLMRSFFLNNLLDPVVYGLFSNDFRKETIKLFKRLCRFVCCRAR